MVVDCGKSFSLQDRYIRMLPEVSQEHLQVIHRALRIASWKILIRTLNPLRFFLFSPFELD